jgi:uncharacterized protein (TIGR03435 family)
LLLAAGLSAASPAAFEVASVKRVTATAQGVRTSMLANPARLDYVYVTLKDVIRQAYGVKNFQISGPDWIAVERYDIAAKPPQDTATDQIPAMLQSLLAERFKLTLHRDSKELPVYALATGRNGRRFHEAAPGGTAGIKLGVAEGNLVLDARATTVPAFIDFISRFVDRPIVDDTGMPGQFDFTLKWIPDRPVSMNGNVAGGDSAQDAPGSSIFAAVQEQLGLSLEARRGSVEILVIDHAEREPTGN